VLPGCPYLLLFSLFVPLSIAFSLQDENLGVIDKPVGDRGGHSGAVKDIPPLSKRQICRYHCRLQFMPVTDDLEEQV
jgi:hypothetical protein